MPRFKRYLRLLYNPRLPLTSATTKHTSRIELISAPAKVVRRTIIFIIVSPRSQSHNIHWRVHIGNSLSRLTNGQDRSIYGHLASLTLHPSSKRPALSLTPKRVSQPCSAEIIEALTCGPHYIATDGSFQRDDADLVGQQASVVALAGS